MLSVRKLIAGLLCVGLLLWFWPALKVRLPLAMTLEHGGLVGLFQSDRFFIEKDPVRLRFHANGTVDMLGGDAVVGEPMEYVIEDGEVVIHQS